MENILKRPRPQEVIAIKIGFVFLGIMSLSIAQDYLQSSLFGFGFYWSEVLLFNVKWLLYLPVVWFASYIANKDYHHLVLCALFAAVGHAIINALLISLVSATLMAYHFDFLSLFRERLGSEILLPLIAFGTTVFMRKTNSTLASQSKFTERVLKDSLTVRHKNETLVIRDFNIKWIGREHQTTIIHSNSGKFVYSGSITKLETQLDNLIRIHRSILVNPTQIDRFRSRKNGDYDIILQDGNILRLSRRYRDAVLSVMNGNVH